MGIGLTVEALLIRRCWCFHQQLTLQPLAGENKQQGQQQSQNQQAGLSCC
jgi:hypothetical protein